MIYIQSDCQVTGAVEQQPNPSRQVHQVDLDVLSRFQLGVLISLGGVVQAGLTSSDHTLWGRGQQGIHKMPVHA